MPTESALQSLALLRDPEQFKWFIIPLLVVVLYVYAQQIHEKRWSIIFGGLAFWLMDWINEIWNSLVFHFTQYAPVWGAPKGDTAYQILIGLNIEITFMFAILGITATLLLPADKQLKILGINNRWLLAIGGSTIAVLIECWLNWIGVLSWDYAYWRIGFPYIIFLVGYLPFFIVAYWVHDMRSLRAQVITVSSLVGIVISSLLIFGGLLHWI